MEKRRDFEDDRPQESNQGKKLNAGVAVERCSRLRAELRNWTVIKELKKVEGQHG